MNSMTWSQLPALAALWLCLPLAAAAQSPWEEPHEARLTVTLEVRGDERVASEQSPDHARGTFDDSYMFSVTTRATGELSDLNLKDPGFAAKMMAMAQNPAAGSEGEEDYRFLDYFPYDGCQSQMRVTVNRRLDGEYSDVQGMVPYSVVRSGDHSGDANTLRALCFVAHLVLDVEDQVMFSDGFAMPTGFGTHLRKVQGRPDSSVQDELPLHSEIAEWVLSQLRQAPAAGERRATLELIRNESGAYSGGTYAGRAEVLLRWRLERL